MLYLIAGFFLLSVCSVKGVSPPLGTNVAPEFHIEGQPISELADKGKIAYAKRSDFYLLLSKDLDSVSVVLAKEKLPKNNSALRSHGDYRELPGYSYSPGGPTLRFSKIEYLPGIKSEHDSWAVFRLKTVTEHQWYGLSVRVTEKSIDVEWLLPERLTAIEAAKNLSAHPAKEK